MHEQVLEVKLLQIFLGLKIACKLLEQRVVAASRRASRVDLLIRPHIPPNVGGQGVRQHESNQDVQGLQDLKHRDTREQTEARDPKHADHSKFISDILPVDNFAADRRAIVPVEFDVLLASVLVLGDNIEAFVGGVVDIESEVVDPHGADRQACDRSDHAHFGPHRAPYVQVFEAEL